MREVVDGHELSLGGDVEKTAMKLEDLRNIGFCLRFGASRMSWQTSDCGAGVMTYTSRVERLRKYEVDRTSFRKCTESRLTFNSIREMPQNVTQIHFHSDVFVF